MLVAAVVVVGPHPAEAARLATPADAHAGGSATTLLRNLTAAQEPGHLNGFLFGQQHANWDSKRYRSVDDVILDWRGPRVALSDLDGFVSDIELATTLIPGLDTHRPAVYGFSLRTALRLNDADRNAYADRIVDAYADGGLVTIHFPADNPVTGLDHRDVSANALCLLGNDWSNPPEAAVNAVANWQAELGEAADFFRLVNTRWRDPDADGFAERDGRVAMVFRPFHEMLRVTHWWSAAYYHPVHDVCEGSAAASFRALWRQTFDYLVAAEHQDVHGLLFAWSPDRPTAAAGWETFYPNAGLGAESVSDYVDVIAFDVYEETSSAFSQQLVADAAAVTAFNASLAPADREVVAVGEFGPASGLSTVSEGNWFMQSVVQPLSRAGLIDQIAYAMTWSNMDAERYWIPLPCFNVPECETVTTGKEFYDTQRGGAGDPLRGFRAFVKHPGTIFLEDLPEWWRLPNPSLPFQPGDSPPALKIPCWIGHGSGRDDAVRLEPCPTRPFGARPVSLRR